VWRKQLSETPYDIVLGVRSSVFLPFRDLGLVIVDEEHENTYKQQEHAPRYHARNAAIILSIMHGGKTLLGSATPSVESYYNARTGKYGFVQLNERYGGGLTPSFEIIDIAELRRKKIMKNALFSPPLEKHIREALSAGKQIILFQNRRGFAPVTECKSCGWTPHCPNCDVSLTYHRSRGHSRLECHYCGHNEPLPSVCPSCKGSDLQMFGFGTEKVEEETAGLFPAAKVDRLDLDSARSRTSYETILGNFAAGRTDILIGTQILSKGLDFGNVAVVGVLNADSLLNYPDFRSHERAFQLMTQVGGRAGRRESRGTVVVQTSQPNLPVIDMVRRGAYSEMVSMQLAERKAFRYPPFFRLITIVLRGKHEDVVEEAASVYADKLREKLGNARVLGPVIPPVTRVYNMHNRQVILKIEAAAALAPVRGLIEDVRLYVQEVMPVFKSLLIHFDVD
jgi:primosomal protein N' (replication factor Y)